MTLRKRIKNLYYLSGLDYIGNPSKDKVITGARILENLEKLRLEKPRMATIIKRTTPVEEFMNKVNE